MNIFAIDWYHLAHIARQWAAIFELPARILRNWADRVEAEVEADYEREAPSAE